MKLKILALITARKNSKRLPKKNIKILGKKRLIEWSLDFAKKIKLVSDVMVTTDDRKIIQISSKKKILCPWIRPKYLSRGSTSSEKTVSHALNWFEKKKYKLDGVLLLQPTTPFRSLKKINQAIRLFHKKKNKPIISVSKILNNKIYKKFIINGSFYLSSIKYLKKYNNLSPKKFYPIKIYDSIECIDINTKKDLELAKKYYAKTKKKY